MSVHTYIGARYVPRFLGTYDATQIYDALDVVDNGSGTSYIARKTVPAGTPLTDTDYWFVYGASSGAIIQLQNDMIQAQNDILGLQGDIQDINNSKYGNLLVIGNSYVQAGCVDDLKAYFDNAYEYKGGGYGFLSYAGHPLTFDDLLDNAIADTSFDNDTITDIIFVSAVGDCRAWTEDSANFKNDLETVLFNLRSKLSTNFVNLKRRVITLAESRGVPSFSNNKFSALFAVHKIFKGSALTYGFEYIGWAGFNELFKSTHFESDNYHPNSAGAANISMWIKTAYFGNAEYVPYIYSKTNAPFKYTAGTKVTVRGGFTPDEAWVEMGNVSGSSGDPVTLSQNDVIFASDDGSKALPAPWTSNNVYAKYIVASTGVDSEYLVLKFDADSNGCMVMTSALNPTQSVMQGSTINAPGLQGISYPIG